MLRVPAIILLFLAVTACGGGGSGSGAAPPPPAPVISSVAGVATKARIAGGQAVAYEEDGTTEIARATSLTNAEGSFAIDLGEYQGPIIVEVTGGTYMDEATGVELNNTRMRALAHTVGNGGALAVNVTPLTEVVAAQFEAAGTTYTPTNIDTANRVRFGTQVIDVLATEPTDLAVVGATFDENDVADVYALLLAAVSQIQAAGAFASWEDVVPEISADLEGNDLTGFAEDFYDATLALAGSDQPLADSLPASIATQVENLTGLASLLDNRRAGKLSAALLEIVWVVAQLNDRLSTGIDEDFANGSSNENCDTGGSVSRTVSGNRTELVETYQACQGGFFRIAHPEGGNVAGADGVRRITYSSLPTANGFGATVVYENLVVTLFNDSEVVLDGELIISGEGGPFDGRGAALVNLSMTRPGQGTLTAQNVDMAYVTSLDFFNNLSGLDGLSGSISHDVFGRASLSGDNETLQILGRNGTGASISNSPPYARVSALDSNALMFVTRSDIINNDVLADLQRPPEASGIRIPGLNGDTIWDGVVTEIDLFQVFLDPDFELLDLQVSVDSVEISQFNYGAELAGTFDVDAPNVAVQIEQTGPGLFELSSTTLGQRKNYAILLSATDPTDNTISRMAEYLVFQDFDGDGIVDYITDRDDDNDGTDDFSDAFPLDDTEQLDTDLDGIGNNADPDDDNDSVLDADDSYPLDDRCSEAADGDGERCTLTTLSANSRAVLDRDGVVYLQSNFNIGYDWLRYDSLANRFLNPITFDANLFLNAAESQFNLDYIAATHSLYGDYDDEGFSRLALTGSDPESVMHTSGADVFFTPGTVQAGEHVIVVDQITGGIRYTAYDIDGMFVASRDELFDIGTSSSSYRELGIVPFCEIGFYFESASETFVDFTNAGGLNCSIVGHPLPSPTSPIALRRADVAVINTAGETLWEIPFNETPLGWVEAGLVTLTRFDLVQQTIRVYNDAGEMVQELQTNYEGSPQIELLVAGSRSVVMYRFRAAGNQGLLFTPFPSSSSQ